MENNLKNTSSLKTLYEPNGCVYNKDGIEASKMFDEKIREIYTYWLDKGFSPSELREMFFSQIFITTTFEDAKRM